tara:strand:- start:36 stop:395 length:360 start_codon:yes stop_codon:yes gene_type:complete
MPKEVKIQQLVQDLSKTERNKLLFEYSEIRHLKDIARKLDNLRHCLISHTHPENAYKFDKKSDNFKTIVNQLLQKSWSAMCNFDDQLKEYDYLKVADEYHLTFKELSDLYNEKHRKQGG